MYDGPKCSSTTTSPRTPSTRGIAARAGFAESFEGLAAGELDELRTDFVRKAVLAGTDRVCRPLLAAGRTMDDLAAMTFGDVPPSADLDRLRARRSELGLPAGDEVGVARRCDDGRARSAPEALPLHLRRTRLTRVNTEANGSMCRGMLSHRYATRGEGQLEEIT